MHAETIEPVTYRTGKTDRSVALGLALLLFLLAPGLLWAAGPFAWPWGAGACTAALLGGTAAVVWWKNSSRAVVWDGRSELEFQPGGHRVDLGLVTRVEVRPAQMVTLVWVGNRVSRLSHRLVGLEDLLDEVRQRRPELFPLPEHTAVFRVSQVRTVTSLGLGALSLATGLVLAPWVWVWGWVFGAGAFLVWARAVLGTPRAYVVGPGALTVKFWLGQRIYRQLTTFREVPYAAAGALFFRLRLEFGRRIVTLDEGQLLDSLRPWSPWVVARLGFSPSD